MAAKKQRAQGKQAARPETNRQTKNEAERPPRGEWAIGGLSALLVIAMIGFILFQAAAPAGRAPDLYVLADRIAPGDGGFRVAFRAVNRGDMTAASVVIEGRLEQNGEAVETSEVTLDYVPARSEQRGGLYFVNDPAQYRLLLEARGYAEP